MARRLTQAELDQQGRRRCSKCKRIKPLTDFYRDAQGRGGYGYRCKPCTKSAVRAHTAADPDRKRRQDEQYRRKPENRSRARDRRLRQRYGIGEAEYDQLLDSQGGVCAICGGVERDARNREMPVDHNHATGAIRGILCDPCNRIIGLFRDDAKVLRAAIRYLRKWRRRS